MDHAATANNPSPANLARPAIAAAALCAIALMATLLFDTGHAVEGGWLAKALVPLRMLLLVGAASVLLRIAGESWRDVGLARPVSLLRTGLLVVLGYLAIGAGFFVATRIVLPALGLAPQLTDIFSAVRGNLPEYLFWLIPVAWGSAAFGEELVFRGFLQSRLQRIFADLPLGAVLAVVMQAVIFGSLHAYQGAGGAILAGTTGLVLGMLYLAGRRNLWAPIIVHGIVDTISLTAIYLGVAGAVA